jgi:hypothetical protein
MTGVILGGKNTISPERLRRLPTGLNFGHVEGVLSVM